MTVLPAFLQIPLTGLTGRPAPGQRPWRLTPTFHVAGATVSTVLGVALGARAAAGGLWLLALVPAWMLAVHGLRNLRQLNFHQCGHINLYGNARVDAAIGRVVSTLLLIEGFDRYRQEHTADHHSARHMSLHDPTVKALLISIGLRPGMSRRTQWHRLLGKLVSPTFHLRFFFARLRSHFSSASPTQRAVTALVLAASCLTATLTDGWLALTLGWVIPVTVLYQAASVLRLAVKHVFPAPGGPRRGREHFAGLTYGVFLGEPVPTPRPGRAANAAAWVAWTLRMLLIHFPARYLVLTGDTVCHDYHHRHPRSSRWANYVFARQDDIDSGHQGWPPYREVWGFVPAVNLVFDSLTRADLDEFSVARLVPARGRRRRLSLPGDGTAFTPAHLLFEGFED